MPIAYDGIELNIQTSATKAIQQLDLLVGRLNSVVSTLHGINTASFSGLANGVTELSTAMSGLKETATSKDFTNLAKNVNKLAGINASGLRESASAIKEINAAITGVNVPEASAANIKSMTDAMSSFGYERMNKAAANLPIFASEFKNLLTTIASAPEASQNVISLVSAIGSAANGMAALSGKSGAAIGGSSSLWGNFAANLKKSATSLRDFVKNAISARAASSRLGSGIDRLAYTFGKLYASLFLIVRALKGIGNSIISAMNYVETFNYYNVTMNKIGSQFADNYTKYGYDSAQAYSDSFSKRMNALSAKMTGFNIGKNGEMSFTNKMNLALDPELVMNYEAQVASVTNSVGLMGETSLNAAKALTMLAADYSSLRNIDLKTVMTNFSSGLIGQSRALYKYGIDITNATLQTYAYKYGIKTAVSEMTQSDKMQLRLIAILDQSKVAWGDQANTINSVANQYRILKAQGANLARMFGSLFIPMLQSVLPYINAVVMGLQRLVQWVATIFHIDMGKNMAGISKAYSGGADDMEGLADASDDASDSLDKANGSAKALAKTVLGFDEINALSDNSSKDKGLGSGIDLSGPIGDALKAYDNAWNKALNSSKNKAQELLDKLIKYVNAGDWEGLGAAISKRLRDALNSIPWDKVYSAAENFGKGLADFLNGLIRPDTFYAIGRTIANSLNTAFHFLDSFAKEFNWANLGDSVAAGIKGALENIDWPLIFDTMKNFGTGLATFLNHLITPETFSLVGKTIANYLNAALTFLYNFGDTLNWKNIGESIAAGLNSLFDTFDWTLLAKTLNRWVLGLDTAIGTAITKINWGKLLKGIWETLSHLDWKTVATLVAAVAVPAIVKTFFDYFILQFSLKFGIGTAGRLATIIASAMTSAGTDATVVGAGTSLGGTIAEAILAALQSKLVSGLGLVLGAFTSMDIFHQNLGGNNTNKKAEELSNTDFGKQTYSMLNGGKTPNDDWAQKSEKSIEETAQKNKTARAQDLLNQLKYIADLKKNLFGYHDEVSKSTTSHLTSMNTKYTTWGNSVKTTVSDAYTSLKTSASSYLDGQNEKWNGYAAWISTALENVKSSVASAGISISSGLNGIPTAFAEVGTKAGAFLATNIQPGLTSFVQKVGALPSTVSGGLETLKTNVGSAATQAGNALSTNFSAGKDKFMTTLKSLSDTSVSGLGSLSANIGSEATKAGSALKSGFETGSTQFIQMLQSIPTNAKSAFENLTATVGTNATNAGNALKDKFESGSQSFLNIVNSLGSKASQPLGSMAKTFASAGEQAIKGMKDKFSGGVSSLISVVSQIPSRFSSILSGLYSIGANAIKAFINGFRSIHIPVPHIDFGSKDVKIGGLSLSIPTFKGIQWYENGGFPSTGDIFVANEKAPELVGKMGNRTTVANNAQITEGIKSAVEEAMGNVMVAFSSKNGSNAPVNVEVVVKADNETLYRHVIKGKKEHDNRYHVATDLG